ncbi:MAG: glutamine synthetase beta-grasp domain-containing protein, partial [Acidimicrobiaceae bacterium]
MAYQAEYIWIDGVEPTPTLRSKTKILENGTKALPIWGFDGSSTSQATGEASDCILNPVFSCKDPIRGGKNVLVMCEVLVASTGKPHPTNTRAQCAETAKRYADQKMIYGIEQEYTMMRLNGRPFGFPELSGEPAPQGPYYCGVGAGRVMGR